MAVRIANRRPTPRARMRGLSLIELMIAMTISLIVMAAVGWIYQGTAQTYRTQDALARMQEGARYAFEIIGRDLRMAGAATCWYDRAAAFNALKDADTEWWASFYNMPISSLEQNDADAEDDNDASDALRVLYADATREYIVAAHAGSTVTLSNATPNDFADGQLLLATNCNNTAFFQSTGGSSTLNINHTNVDLNAGSTLGVTYGANSRIYRVKAADYFVRDNTLFRRSPQGVPMTLVDEELIEGVQDLQVTYSMDTDVTPDGIPNDPGGGASPYLTADEVEGYATGTSAEKWARVKSVRISLLMQSIEDRVLPATQMYMYNGSEEAIDPGDRRLRKVFTHVVTLRNR